MVETTTDVGALAVTAAAIARILELRQAEDEPDALALRVEITGTNGPEYAYDLTFDAVSDAEPDDVIYQQGELPVIVPATSVDPLAGATLDIPSGGGDGLVLRNPNRPDPLAGKVIELTGTIADKVQQLLTSQINPSLAAHGGYAELAGVEGTTVYVTMGGGCQGCAVSSITLRTGIARSIQESIPEVTEVVDTTNHDAGRTPFYA